MVQIQGLSLEQLADLYDASSDEVKQWMLDNSSEWVKEKTESINTRVYGFTYFNKS